MSSRATPSAIAPGFLPASLSSARTLPNERVLGSTDAGWTSVLLELHRSRGQSPVFEPAVTPDQTIVVAIEAEHELEVWRDGRWRRAVYRPGTVGLTAAHDSARMRWQARGRSFQTAHLYVPQPFFLEAADHFRRAGQKVGTAPLSARSLHEPTVAQAVRALLHAMMSGATDPYAESAATWLATHLASRGPAAGGDDTRLPGTLTDRRLTRVIEFMSAHYAQPLSLQQLATEAAVSKFHFTRLFARKMGSTPYEFLVRIRLEAARGLLANSDLPVSTVARSCGYPTPSGFAAAFRKHVGMSPSVFRVQILARATGIAQP